MKQSGASGGSVPHTNQRSSFSTAFCPACELTRGVVTCVKTVEVAARTAEAKRKRDDAVTRAERHPNEAEEAAMGARNILGELRAGQ